jgi:hypothetical protein
MNWKIPWKAIFGHHKLPHSSLECDEVITSLPLFLFILINENTNFPLITHDNYEKKNQDESTNKLLKSRLDFFQFEGQYSHYTLLKKVKSSMSL